MNMNETFEMKEHSNLNAEIKFMKQSVWNRKVKKHYSSYALLQSLVQDKRKDAGRHNGSLARIRLQKKFTEREGNKESR
jgi:hypothetical protein